MSSYYERAASVTEGLLDPFSYGRGYFESVNIANPAAGANAQDKLGGQFLSRLVSARFRLVTDNNVANRFVTVDVQDGNGNTILSQGNLTSVVASKTADYFYGRKQALTQDALGLYLFAPLDDFFLEPGRIVQITVANIQAGDQLSRIFLGYERFPTGPRGYPEGRVGPHDRHAASLHRPAHHATRL